MSGDDEQRLKQLTDHYHDCCDNGQMDAADTIRYKLQKLIEDKIDDSQTSQYEIGNKD